MTREFECVIDDILRNILPAYTLRIPAIRFDEVAPIIRTTGLDRNPCVFLSRKRLCFWDSTKQGVYAKEKAIV